MKPVTKSSFLENLNYYFQSTHLNKFNWELNFSHCDKLIEYTSWRLPHKKDQGCHSSTILEVKNTNKITGSLTKFDNYYTEFIKEERFKVKDQNNNIHEK